MDLTYIYIYVGRNYASVGKLEKLFDVMSILSGIAGSVGLILLSIFDLARHRTLHIIFLTLFMMGIHDLGLLYNMCKMINNKV